MQQIICILVARMLLNGYPHILERPGLRIYEFRKARPVWLGHTINGAVAYPVGETVRPGCLLRTLDALMQQGCHPAIGCMRGSTPTGVSTGFAHAHTR
jgi:hypothetical protein